MNPNLKTIIYAVVSAAMLLASLPAQAQSPQDTFKQYVADLQKNPNDNALREKIIKLALTLNPKPAASQDVAMHEGAAEYAIKHAKTAADFADAAKEYEQALLLAPWLAADYFNCGVAYEKAEQYDAAVRNFNLYLVAAPGAKDTNDVLKRIGGLEYAGHKAAKESSPEVVAERKQNNDAELIKSLDGVRYTYQLNVRGDLIVDHALDIRGTTLIHSTCLRYHSPNTVVENPVGVWIEHSRMQIVGRQATFSRDGMLMDTFTISEDGKSITWPMGGDIRVLYREK